jgi:hypothetical protein
MINDKKQMRCEKFSFFIWYLFIVFSFL